MARLAYRVVQHGVYCMQFRKSKRSFQVGVYKKRSRFDASSDPIAYAHTASSVRPDVRIRHAWYIEHKTRLGSCPDSLLIDALTPAKRADPGVPSQDWSDYDVPSGLTSELVNRVLSCIDLVDCEWKTVS